MAKGKSQREKAAMGCLGSTFTASRGWVHWPDKGILSGAPISFTPLFPIQHFVVFQFELTPLPWDFWKGEVRPILGPV